MCLAIPGKILNIDDNKIADVDFDGIVRKSSVELVPSVNIGDYVLVHAGYAIEIIDQEEAKKSLDLIQELSTV